MSDKRWKVGDVVELANKEGGFTDHETGFDISRNQKMELKGRIGTLTNEALMSGGLLVVTSKSKRSKSEDDDEGSTDGDDYPEDFPGREAFVEAGLSFDQAKNLQSEDELLAIKGIGPKTIKDLNAWAKKNK
jgi:hypothetical protein